MAASQDDTTTDETDDGLSTVNTNVRVVRDQRQRKFADHDRMIILAGVEDVHDVVAMTNRITDEYGDVSGVEKVSGDVYLFFAENY